MCTHSAFSPLYKNNGVEYDRQEERRKFLLEQQKKKRHIAQDEARLLMKPNEPDSNQNQYFKEKRYKIHKLQISEWFTELPQNIEDWILVPCPKGLRCLMVSKKGITTVYNKKGIFIRSFKSCNTTNDLSKHQKSVLDCIYVKQCDTFFVLDIIEYGFQEMINCEAQFRFFWVRSKFLEGEFEKITPNIKLLNVVDMENENSVAECLQRFPQWENNTPELDGFLFYHKEASYVYGKTPLVCWLYSFMIPEILNLAINDEYFRTKPEGYLNCFHFIKNYNIKKYKRMKKQPKTSKDEVENLDSISNILEYME